MNNQWNRIIYKIWMPIYDVFFERGPFVKAREKTFENILFKKGSRVLVVGVGTGAELHQLPHETLKVTAIDYSADMLNKAKQKFSNSNILLKRLGGHARDH